MIKTTTRFWLFACFLFLTVRMLWAVPAVPWPVEKIQPDGSKITVYIRGDEKVHWMESLDGYALMYDDEKYIVYAELDADKNLIPSKTRFSAVSVAPDGLGKGLSYSPSQVRVLEQIWDMATEGKVENGPQRAAAPIGERKALCVLMGFSDRDFVKSKAEFETLFNQVGLYNSTTKGSVKDFFRENSYGKMDLTVTVAGPYHASKTRAYCADNPQEFARLAAQAANADINFNDFADNGSLETFHIVFAGYGDESIDDGKQIWSHKWELASPITLDGVRVSVYSCSPELRGSSGDNITHVGVICHELTHVFGAPDYYDTGDVGYGGSGSWDLMANGSWNDSGRQPAHINMFQKILFGWVTPTPLTTYTEVAAMPPSALQPVAYTIPVGNNGEQYVLENRQLAGFDASLPGHGLLIWHVHPGALGGNASNAAHPQQMYPVSASSLYDIPDARVDTYGAVNSSGTPFPGRGNRVAFTANTTPAMFTWTGLQKVSKPITDIAEADDNTVSFKFMQGEFEFAAGLQASVSGGDVTLSWTESNNESVSGYKIYRDGVLQYTINHKTVTSYTQKSVPNGSYEYGVSAFSNLIESTPATKTVTVTGNSNTSRFPVRNLQGSATPDRASLSWTAPFSGGWMTIAGDPALLYSFGGAFRFFAGTSWQPEHLRGMDGYEITQILFYLNETATGVAYAAQVWEVNQNGSAQLKASQAYTESPSFTEGFTVVSLNTPVVIDASKEYRIGVEIKTMGEDNCLITDAGPIVPGRNWLYDTAYGSWYLMENAGVKENFFTSAYLSSGNSLSPSVVLDSRTQATDTYSLAQQTTILPEKTMLKAVRSGKLKIEEKPQWAAPALTSYIVYRNGVEVGTVTDLAFTDTGLTPGTTYSYCVKARYSNGETAESACIELTTGNTENPYKPVEDQKAELTGNTVTLTWNPPFAGGTFGYADPTISRWTSFSFTGTMAIRFTPDDLKKLFGMKLKSVRYIAHSDVTSTNTAYTLRIYAGTRGNEPERLIHEQAVSSITPQDWNTINLSTPLEIDIYEDLWIGIEAKARIGDAYRMSVDTSQPAVDGKGNLLYQSDNEGGGAWTTLLGYAGRDYNWAIVGVAESGQTGSPAFLSHGGETRENTPLSTSTPVYTAPINYQISRNGEAIATLAGSARSYTDVLSAYGKYAYGVTALYDGDQRSNTKTAEVAFGVTGFPTVDTFQLTAYPNPLPSGKTLYVKTDRPGALLRIFSLSGTLLKQQEAKGEITEIDLRLPAGIYILSAGQERIKIIVR